MTSSSVHRPTFDASRRAFLQGSAVSALALATTSTSAFGASKPDESQAPVVFRAVVTSDVHFDGDPKKAEVTRFQRAIRVGYDRAAKAFGGHKLLDALLVVGDMTNHGTENELVLFRDTMKSALKPETTPVMCMGNHEFYGGNRVLWESVFGVAPNRRYEVNGYQFVAVSPLNGSMQPGDYGYAGEWFAKEMAAAYEAAPDKPIFVLQHYPVTPTIVGGRAPDDWGLLDLYETLQKYPTAVDFAGHTHYPIKNPRCEWQGNFTAFGTSSVSYICHERRGGRYVSYPHYRREYGEMYLLEIDADNVVTLLPYDLALDSYYDFCYRFAPGKVETYKRSDALYYNSERPSWAEGAALQKLRVTDHSATIRIPQATSKDGVYEYRCELQRRSDDGSYEQEAPQYFISQYFKHEVPDAIDVEVEALATNANYRLDVYAINHYGRESTTALALEFQTSAQSSDPTVATPAPDLVDLCVRNGEISCEPSRILPDGATTLAEPVEIYDVVGNHIPCVSPSLRPVLVVGAPPKICHSETLERDVMRFDGATQALKTPFNRSEYAKLTRVSVVADCCPDPTRTQGTAAIFANMEGRGCGLCVDYEKRSAVFWAYVYGHGYVKASAPIEFGEWHNLVGTFDGRVVVLYVDGVEANRVDAVGLLRHPDDPFVLAFAVGADIAQGGACNTFYTGDIDRVKLYSWPMNAAQVASLIEKK